MSWHSECPTSASGAPAQFSTDAQKEFIRRHGTPAEEVLGHPVILSFHHEGVGGTAVQNTWVNNFPPVFNQPCIRSNN